MNGGASPPAPGAVKAGPSGRVSEGASPPAPGPAPAMAAGEPRAPGEPRAAASRDVVGPAACDACLRRSWLLDRVGGFVEIARHGHAALPEVLALGDEELVRAVAGRAAGAVLAEWERFDARAAEARALAAGTRAVCRHDALFPPQLLHARDAPAVLHVAGSLGLLPALGSAEDPPPAVAIVGARRATAEGREVARALARDLAVARVTVVSGMALGVDSAAQRGALDGGGLSVAVLAGGADVPYPRSARALHADLVDRGLVLSELPPGAQPRRWGFPARNRIIAGLAQLTVVVEAAQRSGSLITAELAAGLGREVAAVPGAVTSPLAAGTNALLRDGATLVRGVQDVLDALFGAGAAPAVRATPPVHLEPRLAAVLGAVQEGCDPLATPGADPEQALVDLTELELRGLLRREPGGRYAVVL